MKMKLKIVLYVFCMCWYIQRTSCEATNQGSFSTNREKSTLCPTNNHILDVLYELRNQLKNIFDKLNSMEATIGNHSSAIESIETNIVEMRNKMVISTENNAKCNSTDVFILTPNITGTDTTEMPLNTTTELRPTLTTRPTLPDLELHENCTDNPFIANCKLIVKASFCSNKYYSQFCCKSCFLAGQLPS